MAKFDEISPKIDKKERERAIRNMPKEEQQSFDIVGPQHGWGGSLAASLPRLAALPRELALAIARCWRLSSASQARCATSRQARACAARG